MCLGITWGFCYNADSDSAGLRWGLGSTFYKLPGIAHDAGQLITSEASGCQNAYLFGWEKEQKAYSPAKGWVQKKNLTIRDIPILYLLPQTAVLGK